MTSLKFGSQIGRRISIDHRWLNCGCFSFSLPQQNEYLSYRQFCCATRNCRPMDTHYPSWLRLQLGTQFGSHVGLSPPIIIIYQVCLIIVSPKGKWIDFGQLNWTRRLVRAFIWSLMHPSICRFASHWSSNSDDSSDEKYEHLLSTIWLRKLLVC